MRPLPLVRVAALATAALLALGACSVSTGSKGTSKSNDGKLVIGSMIWDTSVPFYSNFIKGQQEAAARLGAELVLVSGKGDIGEQASAVQQLTAKGVDAIVVTASDPTGIAPAVKAATAAGIPVFAANNRVDDSAGVITFIGADDYEFGKRQGELLVQSVGENAKVAHMLGALGTSGQILREKGFTDYLKDHPGIKIVDKQTADWDAAKALTVTQNWLTKYAQGSIDAIVDQGPEAANAAKYAHEHGRTDVKFVLGDYPAEVRAGIEAGYIVGTVNQDPKPQGVRSIESAVAWAKGEQDKVKRPNDYLDLPLVTKANVAEFPPAWGG